MAGKKCPNCGKATFFKTPTGGSCSSCGYTMEVRPNDGTGGKGIKCLNCGNYTVFKNVCRSCGAEYKVVKK
ncbi:MAG: hypothetical protein NC395_05845 [Prevotella sp.]|nr:hypothetical protein [Prevotella sp.]